MVSVGYMVASRLRKMRKDKGWSQKEVSRILGESQSKISAIETGDRMPDIETLTRFCELYSTDANSILNSGYPRILSGTKKDPPEPEKAPEEKKEAAPPATVKGENQQPASAGCQGCLELYKKLVQAQEHEIALLQANAALRARNKELRVCLSLPTDEKDESPQVNNHSFDAQK